MPTNASSEYLASEKEYTNAKTTAEKIKALQVMYSLAPKHKSSEGLLKEIKTKISRFKEKGEKDRAKKSKGFSLAIKKEGAAQIVLVGLTNSGKSSIIKKFTRANPVIASYEFTTKLPEIGIMDYNSLKLQLVEIPALFEDYIKSDKGPTFFSIVRSSDLIVLLLDGTKDCNEQLKFIKIEFEKAFLNFGNKTIDGKPVVVLITKKEKGLNTNFPICLESNFKEIIWSHLNLIYVYTKQPGKPKDMPAVALDKWSTIKELASMVHKDFLDKFKFARVWGKSVKHNGANAGLNHVLEEGDVVEFHMN